MITNTEIAQLLAVKLCHDLSGPIGAISNGTELLKDGQSNLFNESLDLVDGSAKDAVARILLYRQAYGTSGGQVGVKSLNELTNNYFSGSKTDVFWSEEFFHNDKLANIPGNFAKLILLLILLLGKTLIFGGKIHLQPQQNNNENSLIIKSEGKSVKIDSDIINILSNKNHNEKITIKNIQAYLISELLICLDMGLRVDITETSISIICNNY
jgi:histidine phosphotransferase ChpT